MRHQAEPEQSTRLLVQKPTAYAELDENARIAISVLQEDGWKIERIGATLSCDFTVTATPIETPSVVAQASAEIESAKLRFGQLRDELFRELRKARQQYWLGVAGALGLGAALGRYGSMTWAAYLVLGCVAVYAVLRVRAGRGKGNA